MKYKYNNYNGFTLVELAMVLFILALLLGTLLTPLATSIEQQDRETTTKLLEDIRDSLLGYAIVNGHFPCPDCSDTVTGSCATVNTVDSSWINNGEEDGVDNPVTTATNDRSSANFVSCATEVGNLPWVTLDVPENDAWGTRFIYRVNTVFADNTDGTASCTNPAANVSFCLDSANDATLDVQDVSGSSVAADVPAIVVSVGNNSDELFANFSSLEQQNQDGTTNTIFISDDYQQQSGAEFDDLLIWITPPTLMFHMVKAEKLP